MLGALARVIRVRIPLTQYTSFFLQIKLCGASQYKQNLTNQYQANEVIAQWLLLCSFKPAVLVRLSLGTCYFGFLFCIVFFPFIYHKRASGRLLFWFSYYFLDYFFFTFTTSAVGKGVCFFCSTLGFDSHQPQVFFPNFEAQILIYKQYERR